MKLARMVLLICAIVLLSTLTYGTVVADDQGGTNGFSSNGIVNFTVHVSNQNVLVFRYFNISSPFFSHNLPSVNENRMVPLTWMGTGNVTIVPAIPFSAVGNFSLYNNEFDFLYFYKSNYLGILLTTGMVSESGDEVLISDSGTMAGFSVSFINSPLSQLNFTSGSLRNNGNFYYGSYSSFHYYPGIIQNYSLVNNQSSVSVISSFSSPGNSVISLNTSSLAGSVQSGILASDGLFPLIYSESFNSSVTIRLSDGFNFTLSEGERGTDSGGDQDPYSLSGMPYLNERVFEITSNSRLVASVDVYGQASFNSTVLTVNSPMSFVVVRFLPSLQSSAAIGHGNGGIGNATTEIYVYNQAYFVPFSPNITAQNLSFSQGKLLFQFVQNASQQFVIVIQGNFTVTGFSVNGNGSSLSHYSVQRSGNETMVTFSTNGTGQRNLTLSVTPYVSVSSSPNELPFLVLLISVTVLVAVTGSMIVYSRRRWERKIEKE